MGSPFLAAYVRSNWNGRYPPVNSLFSSTRFLPFPLLEILCINNACSPGRSKKMPRVFVLQKRSFFPSLIPGSGPNVQFPWLTLYRHSTPAPSPTRLELPLFVPSNKSVRFLSLQCLVLFPLHQEPSFRMAASTLFRFDDGRRMSFRVVRFS